MRRSVGSALLLAMAAMLVGCGGEQSVLAPKGEGAHSIRVLAVVLFAGGAAVLVIVLAVTAAALWGSPSIRQALGAEKAIVIGGIAFPAVVLTALLIYGVLAMAPVRAGESPVRIAVESQQWWWRVRYDLDGTTFETANEIHIPVGRPVEFVLTSTDVIHSFWVPNLAGKIDMLPGRTTRLVALATEAGIMRGQCAEFCGGPHGLMSLRVVAMNEGDFAAWAAQSRTRDTSGEGYRLFMAAGCGGCHAIDGTDAKGRIGPDLTGVGGRAMLAAETLPVTRENMAQWIAFGKAIKPENRMPEFSHLTQGELTTLSDYLMRLK